MRTFTVAFQYDDGGREYVTQPMTVDHTFAFLVDANNQAMILNEVREVSVTTRRVV